MRRRWLAPGHEKDGRAITVTRQAIQPTMNASPFLTPLSALRIKMSAGKSGPRLRPGRRTGSSARGSGRAG